jgi:hypothetical protein
MARPRLLRSHEEGHWGEGGLSGAYDRSSVIAMVVTCIPALRATSSHAQLAKYEQHRSLKHRSLKHEIQK